MVSSRSSTPHSAELDWLVLTAANRSQALAYKAELRERRDLAGEGWEVVADPRGRRLGSGGAVQTDAQDKNAHTTANPVQQSMMPVHTIH